MSALSSSIYFSEVFTGVMLNTKDLYLDNPLDFVCAALFSIPWS